MFMVDQFIPNWCLTRWQHRRHFCASHPFLMHCMPVCSVSFVSWVNFLRMLNNVASVNSGLETIDRGDDVGGSANAMQCNVQCGVKIHHGWAHFMISDLSWCQGNISDNSTAYVSDCYLNSLVFRSPFAWLFFQMCPVSGHLADSKTYTELMPV